MILEQNSKFLIQLPYNHYVIKNNLEFFISLEKIKFSYKIQCDFVKKRTDLFNYCDACEYLLPPFKKKIIVNEYYMEQMLIYNYTTDYNNLQILKYMAQSKKYNFEEISILQIIKKTIF